MEKIIKVNDGISSINIIKEKEDKEIKNVGPSKLALSLRKDKINQKIGKFRILREKDKEKVEFGNKEINNLCNLSRYLNSEKDNKKITDILDKIYFFLSNFEEQIESEFVGISKIIPNLFSKLVLLKENQVIVKKIFDIFYQIARLIPPIDLIGKFGKIFNEENCQFLYGLIDYYQNNRIIIEKLFSFLCDLITKSDLMKIYLMTKPGFDFIQAVFSLDTKYPIFFIKLLSCFCTLNKMNDKSMKEFQLIYVEKCNKIISLFYDENHTEAKNVINNSFTFINLYKCLYFISLTENNDVLDIFLINKKNNDKTLYEKILIFEKIDSDNLCSETLKITGNLYCSSEKRHIQSLIKCNSHEYVMNMLSERFNRNIIIRNAAWALSNFVGIEEYRKIFIKNNYIKDLIIVLNRNNNYEVRIEILNVICNLIIAISKEDILTFVNSDLAFCCTEILKNIKEPYILELTLSIVEFLIFKSGPEETSYNSYKNINDKFANPFKYQFESHNLPEILKNFSNTHKSGILSEYSLRILKLYFIEDDKIMVD